MTLNRDARLRDALRALGRDDAERAAPAYVEAHVIGEIRRLARDRRIRTARRGAALAVAAVVVVAATVALIRVRRSERPADAAGVAQEITTAFLPLPYAGVPVSNGAIVRLRVPRTALASFGLLAPDASDAASDATVTADVIVGDDGLARAVRFVRASVHKEQTR